MFKAMENSISSSAQIAKYIH